jgi:mono/diheme cytochrome c family protein
MTVIDFKKDPIVRSSILYLRSSIFLLAGLLALSTGCRKEDMSDQPKFYKPYKETSLFADGTTARPLPQHTIARGHLELEKDLFTGMKAGTDGKFTVPIDYIPVTLTKDDILRGQEKFNIYCAVCHGKTGAGDGMIVTRGMIRPPSFVRLDNPPAPTDPAYARYVNVQRAPAGHYYDVITNGYGAMYSYNDRIGVEDRWRIVAYIKALQVSQDFGGADKNTMQPAPANGAPVPVQSSVQPAK